MISIGAVLAHSSALLRTTTYNQPFRDLNAAHQDEVIGALEQGKGYEFSEFPLTAAGFSSTEHGGGGGGGVGGGGGGGGWWGGGGAARYILIEECYADPFLWVGTTRTFGGLGSSSSFSGNAKLYEHARPILGRGKQACTRAPIMELAPRRKGQGAATRGQ